MHKGEVVVVEANTSVRDMPSEQGGIQGAMDFLALAQFEGIST